MLRAEHRLAIGLHPLFVGRLCLLHVPVMGAEIEQRERAIEAERPGAVVAANDGRELQRIGFHIAGQHEIRTVPTARNADAFVGRLHTPFCRSDVGTTLEQRALRIEI
jgi:hypothetical protein